MTNKCRNSNWVLYILRCSDQTLYTGITNNLDKRFQAHQAGKGAKYTRGRGPFKVTYIENFQTKNAAAKREAAVKRLSKASKLKLISSLSECQTSRSVETISCKIP
jgi:putative endonuclease